MLTQLPLVIAPQEYQSQTPLPRRRICDLPAEERPLYRLHHYGSNGLSTTELLSLLLGTVEAPAAAIIVAHNHPSGEVSPSPEDVTVTWQLVKAGKLLDIEVLDHVVVGQGGQFASLKELGAGFDVA